MSDGPLNERVIELEDPEADAARGRALRRLTPRRALAQLVPSPRSALEILLEQNTDRLPQFVPLRFARMLADPFSFYRGSAAVMAADLAAGPSLGLNVAACGDAHLSNFGVFAAPDRALVFDLNDFDESAMAPPEWDVKRLLTSVIVGGRQCGHPQSAIRSAVAGAMEAYRNALYDMLQRPVLDRYYLRVEPEDRLDETSTAMGDLIRGTVARARKRTSARVFARIMTTGPDGTPRLREAPPVLQHVDLESEARLAEAISEYVASVPVDVAVLLSHFRLTDIALRVVGVGSVGTRCYLAVLIGPRGEPLILQIKEATRSVLEEFGGRQQPQNLRSAIDSHGQGRRVVDGQRVLQAMSDVFLGTVRMDGRDYYVRQFHDMKGSVDIAGMAPDVFGEYVGACAALLARAHAQSANASMLRGYTGTNDAVSDALIAWSWDYADKSFDDFQQLAAAARAGAIEVALDPAR